MEDYTESPWFDPEDDPADQGQQPRHSDWLYRVGADDLEDLFDAEEAISGNP